MNKKNIGKITILVIVIIAFAIFAARQKEEQSVPPPAVPLDEEAKPDDFRPEQPANLPSQESPRLVSLGADSCVPCRMMVPIREELRNELEGKLQVEFIDVWKDRSAGGQYRIRVIPTLIFFDPSGKELFRHEGFISKEDILSKWKELGFNLEKGT
ncbi:MAG: thioredoxin family protein [Candidatus Omnitrophota bacterium]